ncbi:MAG TPA: ABC transporter permease [Caldilineae bacterium]|nr:ABC transporter permease [Caldilineae bacterium]
MLQFIVRRILWAIPVLLAVTFFTFALVRAIPGGPFDFAGDRSLPPSVVANLEAKYHLSDPLWQQFCSYLIGDTVCRPGDDSGRASKGVLLGDLGPSFRYRGRTVNDIIATALPISFQLGMMAMMLGIGIGIPFGVLAALKHNTWIDYSATLVAILGVSVSNVVLGPVLIWFFALKLGWFPVATWAAEPLFSGIADKYIAASEQIPMWVNIIPKPTVDFFMHAALPVFALGTALSATIARMTRGSLLQVIREDYIRTARSKGLRERAVVVRHALKNSLIPVVTILGPMFAGVLTGTFVIELIFAIPGLGRHFVNSIGNRDYPVVLGTTLLYGVAIVIANMLVDITYAWLDPRVRLE